MEEEAFLPSSWVRYTDNCTSQFKSQYTLNDLTNVRTGVSPSIAAARWMTFEPDHGKNRSDGLGSFVKQSAERTIMRIMSGLGDESPDQLKVIVEQLREQILASLHFQDGKRVGNLSFLR